MTYLKRLLPILAAMNTKKGWLAAIPFVLAIAATLAINFSRDTVVEQGQKFVSWYCVEISEEDRLALREAFNTDFAHKVTIDCSG